VTEVHAVEGQVVSDKAARAVVRPEHASTVGDVHDQVVEGSAASLAKQRRGDGGERERQGV
jgi:hypothetical protein